jgi:hypothetical protein
MNNIHLLDSDLDAFQNLLAPEDSGFADLVGKFNGAAITEDFGPLKIELNPDTADLPRGDFPSLLLPHIPVFSRHAADLLASVLTPYGQLWPLLCEDAEYIMFNVTTLVDAMNEDDSDIVRFKSGRIMEIRNYVLNERRLNAAPIFKLPQTALMDVFVTDEFVNMVLASHLKGFSFKPVTLVAF